MSTEQNKALIQRYLEAINGQAKPAELIAQYVDDEHLREHIAFIETAFPRFRLEPGDLIAEGDRVVLRFTAHVQHLGDFNGLPPTGREATFDGIIIYRIAGGRIAQHWMQVDVPNLMRQLTETAPSPVPA